MSLCKVTVYACIDTVWLCSPLFLFWVSCSKKIRLFVQDSLWTFMNYSCILHFSWLSIMLYGLSLNSAWQMLQIKLQVLWKICVDCPLTAILSFFLIHKRLYRAFCRGFGVYCCTTITQCSVTRPTQIHMIYIDECLHCSVLLSVGAQFQFSQNYKCLVYMEKATILVSKACTLKYFGTSKMSLLCKWRSKTHKKVFCMSCK